MVWLASISSVMVVAERDRASALSKTTRGRPVVSVVTEMAIADANAFGLGPICEIDVAKRNATESVTV